MGLKGLGFRGSWALLKRSWDLVSEYKYFNWGFELSHHYGSPTHNPTCYVPASFNFRQVLVDSGRRVESRFRRDKAYRIRHLSCNIFGRASHAMQLHPKTKPCGAMKKTTFEQATNFTTL